MRTFLAGVVVVLLLILANVVAAGVVALFGPLFADTGDLELAALVVVAVAAIAASLLFLKGCQSLAFAAIPFGHRDPNKGLKSSAARRGG